MSIDVIHLCSMRCRWVRGELRHWYCLGLGLLVVFAPAKVALHGENTVVGVTKKNSLPSESSENTVLDESQYGESNGGDRFSIGRSMTKLCVKINQNCGAMRAKRLLSTNAEINEMDPKL